jgi:hypothetical protein
VNLNNEKALEAGRATDCDKMTFRACVDVEDCLSSIRSKRGHFVVDEASFHAVRQPLNESTISQNALSRQLHRIRTFPALWHQIPSIHTKQHVLYLETICLTRVFAMDDLHLGHLIR